ncbi:hypothetical protein ACWFN4_27970 [Bacillus mycoides]
MKNFQSVEGTITMISDFATGSNEEMGCNKLISVNNGYGTLINFVVKPNTYFIDYATVVIGDKVSGFYDANAPVPLIFPPQFQAIVMAKYKPHQNVKVDYFNEKLESGDGKLKLNISPSTQILLTNGQFFTGNLVNLNLIAIYGLTTMSIPAQTTPYKIIVLC